MEKYFKRLPKVNEGWRLKSTSKYDNMVKSNRWKRYKNIKKSSSEYRAEKITGFTNENVREKKNRWKHIHLNVTGVKFIMFILKQPP